MEPLTFLHAELARCDGVISYRALSDEPDPQGLAARAARSLILLPSDKTTDPLAWAGRCAAECGGRVAVLVPGRRFDAQGTRHGRGGGWYDRFLQALPEEWLRVGVTAPSGFSPVPLTRQPWDMPVDWVAVRTDDGWEARRTNARGR
jgi:hypothetical protein